MQNQGFAVPLHAKTSLALFFENVSRIACSLSPFIYATARAILQQVPPAVDNDCQKMAQECKHAFKPTVIVACTHAYICDHVIKVAAEQKSYSHFGFEHGVV
jgi:hypothetical protein